jgi:twitching motility two-component system response regulator PilH
MSEAMIVPPLTDATAKRTPTVYFIDDSATMREVVKIAFRRENINVITCSDAASALAQFEQTPPDAVITDVIMPDQDGYSVCTQVKQHPQFGGIPVVLMSGVVNKTVADKAVAVHADELIRKPFQPQELIGRVKALLNPKPAPTTSPDRAPSPNAPNASNVLTNLFAPPPAPNVYVPLPTQPESAWPRALADAFTPRPVAGLPGPPQHAQPPAQAPARPPASNADVQKLRGEIARLELLVKKLQTELQIERQYNQALELQIHTLIHSDSE